MLMNDSNELDSFRKPNTTIAKEAANQPGKGQGRGIVPVNGLKPRQRKEPVWDRQGRRWLAELFGTKVTQRMPHHDVQDEPWTGTCRRYSMPEVDPGFASEKSS
jgi:hypothetical protein